MRRPGRTGRTTAPVRTPPGPRRARLPLGSGGRACPLAALALALALALAAPAPAAALPFHDVGASTPHRDAIAWLASAGVSEGYPDGTFRPMARVCRQDMAAFLRRLARLRGAGGGEPGGASPFPDVVASTPHRDDILWLAWAGISKGYPDGTFRGMSPVCRQDMAAFLRREAAVGTAFDPAEDGPWTEPGDGALTAVLYADGDLVFQYGEGAAPGREALREGPASSRFWSGYGESGLAGEVRSVSSRCAARPAGRSLNSMFYGCGSLSDVSGLATWDVSGATDMSGMFLGCSSLSDLSPLASWDTSSVTHMGGMFSYCDSLTDLSPLATWDTSSVTHMGGMFLGCPSLSDLSPLASWDTSSVTDMGSMFYGCSSLADLSGLGGWDTSSATHMGFMFSGCASLSDLSGLATWGTSSATSMGGMFSFCSLSDLSALGGWDVSGATDMGRMFYGCSSLADVSGLEGWGVSGAIGMFEMFSGCSSLADVSALEGWDTSSVTDMDQMFSGCPSAPSWYGG